MYWTLASLVNRVIVRVSRLFFLGGTHSPWGRAEMALWINQGVVPCEVSIYARMRYSYAIYQESPPQGNVFTHGDSSNARSIMHACIWRPEVGWQYPLAFSQSSGRLDSFARGDVTIFPSLCLYTKSDRKYSWSEIGSRTNQSETKCKWVALWGWWGSIQ